MGSKAIRAIVAKVLLITFVLAPLSISTACSESISGTTVSISMPNRSVEAGEEFDLDVRIETDTACRGAEFVLTFDPALMKCDGVDEAGFFKDWADANGASTVVLPPTIDNTQGRVSKIGIAIMFGGEGGAKGSGVLCTYHFTALADGTAEPTLSDVGMADESGQMIPDVKVNN